MLREYVMRETAPEMIRHLVQALQAERVDVVWTKYRVQYVESKQLVEEFDNYGDALKQAQHIWKVERAAVEMIEVIEFSCKCWTSPGSEKRESVAAAVEDSG